MKEKKVIYYFTPALLAVLLFASNFLNTDLFNLGLQNFTVWFILSLFSFVCGWLINKTLGWVHGGKVVFAVIVATTIVSLFMISFFKDYFGYNSLLTENLILYSLRNILLGSIGFFGMAVAETILLQNKIVAQENEIKEAEQKIKDHEKEASLLIEEAKLKADKIVFEADKKYKELLEKSSKIENNLKEFIITESELIKRYQDDNE